MPAKKVQLSIYLEPATYRQLESFSTQRRQPKSLVVEAAVASFLSPDASDRREAVIVKRLDRIVRMLERLERNDSIALETLALFVRQWLTVTPALPEQGAAAARASGAARYDRFMDALGRRLASDASVLREVALDIGPQTAAARDPD